jgi:hypothetical protein
MNNPTLHRKRTKLALLKGLAAIAAALAIPSTGIAARDPTYNERVYIARALPAYIRSVPAGCVYLDTRVSTSGAYARVEPVWLVGLPPSPSDPCTRYAANGFYLLRRVTAKQWVIVYNGSEPPPCSRHYPGDLTPCLK